MNKYTGAVLFATLILRVLHYLRHEYYTEFSDRSFCHDNTSANEKLTFDGYTRDTISIPSLNSTCEIIDGWWYLPTIVETQTELPIVVMSHGLGCQKDFGLESYAEELVKNGISVLLFDYRTFGGSTRNATCCTKTPVLRNYIQPMNHVDDIVSVVSYIKEGYLGKHIDINRIGLWGTSFSGGHVLVAGSRLNTQIKAIVSQVPHLDFRAVLSPTAENMGEEEENEFETPVKSEFKMTNSYLLTVLKMTLVAGYDYVRGIFGLTPIYIKIFASGPSDMGFLPLPDGMTFSREMFGITNKNEPLLGDWKNLCPARALFTLPNYHPIDYIEGITYPKVLMIGATRDTLTPIGPMKKAVKILKDRVRFIEKDSDHFPVYTPPLRDELIQNMIQFFQLEL